MTLITRRISAIGTAFLTISLTVLPLSLEAKNAVKASSAQKGGGRSKRLQVGQELGSQIVPLAPVREQVVRYGSYEFRASWHGETENGSFEILRDGKLLLKSFGDEMGEAFRVGCINEDDPGNKLIPIGRDITGSGHPEVVFSEWTGGAHCCFSYHVFELGNSIKKLGTVYTGDGDICKFRNDTGGKIDFVVYDHTFAYWNASFAESPQPEVVIRYGPNGFQPATDLMYRPAPSQPEFEKLVFEGRKTPPEKYGPYPKAGFWEIMLNLIYSGHADFAWKFCDLAWRGDAKTKSKFLTEFRQTLVTSQYWPAVDSMNRGLVSTPTKPQHTHNRPSMN